MHFINHIFLIGLTQPFSFALSAYLPIKPRYMDTGLAGLSTIQFTACPTAPSFECGSFQVPLDYAQPEEGNATLSVARFKATNQTRLGTILTNPGGPGAGGVQFLLETAGELISTITHGQYDIVSWDPRGVNQSLPQISCGFTSMDSVAQFFGDTIPLVGVEALGNFTDQGDMDAFFARVNETDAKFVQMGQRCLETDGSFLKFMGTAAVVRDMVSLADTLEGPGILINYWGFSYGTVLGNYFVNMFPKRVGRVIFDGVVDTIVWATRPTFEIFEPSLSSIDSVLEGFAQECADAGPLNCSLAQNNSTPSSILQGVHNLIDTAYHLHKNNQSSITSYSIRAFIDGQMHNPTGWDAQLVPQLEVWAATLANVTDVDTNNSSCGPQSQLMSRQAVNISESTGTVDPLVQELLSELVISCVDSIDQENVTTQQVFNEVVRVTQEVSPTFGETVFTTGQPFCHRFPVRAVERFTGPFNHTLANPIVVIGNRADPITPFAGAQRVAATLGQSARLVEQNGVGHSTLAENSDCTQDVVRNYFLYGMLPEDGLVCETDQGLFPPNRTLISPSPIARREL